MTDARGTRGKGQPHIEGRAPLLERYKEFGPTSIAVEHRTSVLVLLAIITVMGIFSYIRTPKESFPEVTFAILAVNTAYPGVSPEDVETQITRVLEDEISTISDLDELSSTSVEGFSSIVVTFTPDVNLDDALAKVREKVDLAKSDLPADALDPQVVEFNLTEVPIMQVNLAGEYGLVRLKELGEDLQERFEQIPSVLRAEVRGGLEREVKVDVDLTKLQFYGLALNDVVDAIRSENVNIPGGSIDVGDSKYLVRVDGEFEDPTLIEELVVTTRAGRPVYVRDVATVDFGFAERESYARMNGQEVVTLDIVKRSGENIIETADAVRAVIAELEPTFPPTTDISITGDQSKDIEHMVAALQNHILAGLILIIAVLLFFLGASNSVFVAISIPATMFLTFIVLHAMDVSMNMVVLFSLILALGMLVDDTIVVVENMYRFLEQGWDRTLAAKKATGEVAIPVISSTATTIAAFIPLMFWPGEVGEFMKYLPLTVIVTLSASLVVALIFVPVLCSMFMSLDGTPSRPLRPAARWTLMGAGALLFLLVAGQNILAAALGMATIAGLWALQKHVLSRLANRFQSETLPRFLDRYEEVLHWALQHRLASLSITAAVFAATFVLYGFLGQGVVFFPENMPPSQMSVNLEAPVGTRAAFTDSLARQIAAELHEVGGREDWESVVTTVGSGGGGSFMDAGPGGPEAARVSISLVEFKNRVRDAFETLAEMQTSVGERLAGAELTVDKPAMGAPQGKPVSIEIVGEDPARLKELSDQLIDVLESAPVYRKLVGLSSDLDDARAELSVRVDREKAALYNLSTSRVGGAIRSAINGVEAAKYRTGNDEYDIVVRLAEADRQDLEGLRDLTVMADGGIQIPRTSVATWSVEEGSGAIKRKDQTRMATISSDVAAGLNSNAVLAEVQATLTAFDAALPPGYTIRYTGQSEDQAEAQAFLGSAFLLGLALIALILISQFNSVVKPFIIMTSVLMSTVGVLIGLMVMRMEFSIIMTGVGVISLAGIIVKNGIIIIDYIDTLRERDGMPLYDALIRAGRTRFRPVFLTAGSAALGLIPLGAGLSFNFVGLYTELRPDIYWGGEEAAMWGPLATAVIAGVTFATVLTLVLVPVMYSVINDVAEFFA
ncbi:MAG: efflux RND transporter permease subunit, partial [Gemmatimonadetes bacterium]|nr:efflux RND transporter permease subunit [Gemmatimonadota bacterium]